MIRKFFTYQRTLTWVFLATLLPSRLFAKDIYVSQSGGGTTNSVAWLGTKANWNGSIIAPGDIIHLVGVFNTKLLLHGGGSPGNPITILFEPGAKLSAPTWGQFSTFGSGTKALTDSALYSPDFVHDIVIDGGTDGVIECTSNGHGGTFTNHCAGISLWAHSNIEIKNLTIRNMCIYNGTDNWRPIYPYYTNLNGTTNITSQDVWNNWPTPGAHLTDAKPINFRDPAASTDGIYITPQGSANLFIHNCTFDMLGNGILLAMTAGTSSAWAVNTNIQIYSNRFERYNWGIGWLQSTPFTLCYDSGLWANYFDNSTNWNGNPKGLTSLNNNHGDSIILSCNGDWTGPATNFNMQVYRNYFGANQTTNMSSWLYQETVANATYWQNLKIHNNIFRRDIPNQTSVAALMDINGDNTLVANNTLIGTNALYASVGPPNHGNISISFGLGIGVSALNARPPRIYNNVVYNLGTAIGAWVHLTQPMTNVDYNSYTFVHIPDPGPYPVDNNQYMSWGYSVGTGGTTSWSGWRSLKNDLHGTINRPSFDVNFKPRTTDTVLVSKGTNLTAQGITFDFAGNPRPATGQWTIGAFEVPNNGTTLIIPPSQLSVTNN